MQYRTIYCNPNELYHFGIPGMKWGVRRYQNPDGSYTAAGKARRSRVDRATNEHASKTEKKKQNIGLSEKQKKALIVGAAVAGTALVAIGAYKVNSPKFERIRDKAFLKSFDIEESLLKELDNAYAEQFAQIFGARNNVDETTFKNIESKLHKQRKITKKVGKNTFAAAHYLWKTRKR